MCVNTERERATLLSKSEDMLRRLDEREAQVPLHAALIEPQRIRALIENLSLNMLRRLDECEARMPLHRSLKKP